MPCHISIRDVQFHASETGVQIVVTTDVACHLWCRLTLEPPRIHKEPSYRRGTWLNDDVRFCFVAYEDNEQYELGETLVHTFWKTSWAVCVTKYVYFWGTIGGVACISTSPFFTYHNKGETPVPPPDAMYYVHEVYPERYSLAGGAGWKILDMSDVVPEGATGILAVIQNASSGADGNFYIKKPGGTEWGAFNMTRLHMTYTYLPLDSNRRGSYLADSGVVWYLYIIAFFGRHVVFFDVPRSILPTAPGVYQDFASGADIPADSLLLTALGATGVPSPSWAIRAKGSTKELYAGSGGIFPVSGDGAFRTLQTKVSAITAYRLHWHVVGYIPSVVTNVLNPALIPDPALSTWVTKNLSLGVVGSRWAFLETVSGTDSSIQQVRKTGTEWQVLTGAMNHNVMWCHLYTNINGDIYRTVATQHFYQLGEVHG